MSKVCVRAFAVSLDGFAAGPDQDLDHPLGVGGPDLMEWFFPTRSFRSMHGQDGGETGVDDRWAAAAFDGIGAWLIGRNMFGPIRGPWLDDTWQGWWGDEPPYRVPVFVVTHHARAPLPMRGGTTFRFVTDGIDAAIDAARAAAGDRDVRIGGGAATIRQCLAARLVDELHLAVRLILMGRGEPLFAGLDLASLGYAIVDSVVGERATHVVVRRRDGWRCAGC